MMTIILRDTILESRELSLGTHVHVDLYNSSTNSTYLRASVVLYLGSEAEKPPPPHFSCMW